MQRKINPIVKVLMERDDMSRKEAEELIQDAKEDLLQRAAEGDFAYDICEEYFGLEPDYLMFLI